MNCLPRLTQILINFKRQQAIGSREQQIISTQTELIITNHPDLILSNHNRTDARFVKQIGYIVSSLSRD